MLEGWFAENPNQAESALELALMVAIASEVHHNQQLWIVHLARFKFIHSYLAYVNWDWVLEHVLHGLGTRRTHYLVRADSEIAAKSKQVSGLETRHHTRRTILFSICMDDAKALLLGCSNTVRYSN